MKIITEKEIPAGTPKLTEDLLSTFVDQSNIKIVLIEEGDTLWRFVSQKNKPKYGLFWVDVPTMTSLMSIFSSVGDFNMNNKKKVVHDNLAVRSDWSKLSWRVKVKFNKPIVAYYGLIGPQKLLDSSIVIQSSFGKLHPITEYRIGGFNQYVIPSFSSAQDSHGEKIASISHFVHI
ncbi:MAG: hypothetical protein IPP51_15170 [Bacteroidetes bacterium]|nr:hypothetical protein [Bacteroidota bacterium]